MSNNCPINDPELNNQSQIQAQRQSTSDNQSTPFLDELDAILLEQESSDQTVSNCGHHSIEQQQEFASVDQCPICYRTISSTSGSSYSSLAHPCSTTMDNQNLINGNGGGNNGNKNKNDINARDGDTSSPSNINLIQITRDPISLTNLEHEHHLVNEDGKYSAKRRMFQRLIPNRVTPYSFLTTIFPIIHWLPRYNYKEDFLPDFFTGITVLALQIPQGLAYSKLATVDPIHGLYSSFFAMIIYPFMGTSRHISMGLYAITSMMCRSIVETYSGNVQPPPSNIEILIITTFLAGVTQLTIGILRLGNLSLLFSDNFLSAFTVACSILIVNSQLATSLGINFDVDENADLGIPSETINTYISIIKHIKETNLATLVLSGCVLVFIASIKYYFEPKILKEKYHFKFPVPVDLLAIIFTTIVSYCFDLNKRFDIEVVGDIPSGFLPPLSPRFDLTTSLLMNGIIMGVVASVCQISMAKILARKYGYQVDLNQEIVAYGTCNFICSFLRCFPTCASLARTSVNENAGARSQVSALTCCTFLVLFLFFFTKLLEPLPKATLSCIILVAMVPSLMPFVDFLHVMHISRIDAILYQITLLTVTFLGVNTGIMCGLLALIASVLLRAAIPTSSIKAPIDGSELYVPIEVYQGLDSNKLTSSRIAVFAFHGPLTFLSATIFRSDIQSKVLDFIIMERKQLQSVKNGGLGSTLKTNDIIQLPTIVVSDGSSTAEEKSNCKYSFDDEKKNKKKNIKKLDKNLNETKENFANIIKQKQSIRILILDATQMTHIDVSGIEQLTDLKMDLYNMQVRLLFACCSISVLSTLQRAKFFPKIIDKDDCFLSVHDAVIAARQMALNDDDCSMKNDNNIDDMIMVDDNGNNMLKM
ncbi:hypothetical protein BLOT_010382 [Blomia tropicalis]|nr:hypothetical protein BLOT_010382 [Blomia tropicalis]